MTSKYHCTIHDFETESTGMMQQHIDLEHPGGMAKDAPEDFLVETDRDLSNPYVWEHDDEVIEKQKLTGLVDYRCKDCGLVWREALPEEESTCPEADQ